ncbi:MAG: hypothetical protein AAB217_14070, partial [Chloroflexota bacterium]
RYVECGIWGSFFLTIGVMGLLISLNIGRSIWKPVFLPAFIVLAIVFVLAYVARLIFVVSQRWRK